MTKLKLLALGVLIATSAGVAHAEGKFSLGAGVGVVEHPYKDYDTDVYPVPVINYEGDNFWFRGLGGGYYLSHGQTFNYRLLVAALLQSERQWRSPNASPG